MNTNEPIHPASNMAQRAAGEAFYKNAPSAAPTVRPLIYDPENYPENALIGTTPSAIRSGEPLWCADCKSYHAIGLHTDTPSDAPTPETGDGHNSLMHYTVLSLQRELDKTRAALNVERMEAYKESKRADEALAELAKKTSDLQECVDIAWGVIANAGGGDWNTQSFEWVDAASRWRDKWVAGLDKSKSPTPPTEGSAVEADRLAREAYDEWLHNPSGNSATANLRNKLCAVIGERENLRAQLAAAQEELGYWKAVDKQDRIEMQEVRDELAALQAELADRRDSDQRVLSEQCPSDERHCACVPVLQRELANAQAEARELREALIAMREYYKEHMITGKLHKQVEAALAKKEGER